MVVTWKTVDAWREKAGMEVSELARRAGIPERTFYAGRKKGSPLRAATAIAIRTVFPEDFEREEARSS